MWDWLFLTAAMVAATRLLATAKRPAGAAPLAATTGLDGGWTRGLVFGALLVAAVAITMDRSKVLVVK